jgi:hypothetical protein
VYIFQVAQKKNPTRLKIIIQIFGIFTRVNSTLKTTRQEDTNVCHQSPGRFGRRLRARDSKSGKENSVSVRVRAV